MVLCNGHIISKSNENNYNNVYDNREDRNYKEDSNLLYEKYRRETRKGTDATTERDTARKITKTTEMKKTKTTKLEANTRREEVENPVHKSAVQNLYSKIWHKFKNNIYLDVDNTSFGQIYIKNNAPNKRFYSNDIDESSKYRKEKEIHSFTVQPEGIDYEDVEDSIFELGPVAYNKRFRRYPKPLKRRQNSRFRRRHKRQEVTTNPNLFTFSSGKYTITLRAEIQTAPLDASEAKHERITDLSNHSETAALSKSSVDTTTTPVIIRKTTYDNYNTNATTPFSTKGVEGSIDNSIATMLTNIKSTKTTTATPFNEKVADENIEGTEQMEALLDDIKRRALELIMSHTPNYSDMITNTVTEAIFEADPLLHRHSIKREFTVSATSRSLNDTSTVTIAPTTGTITTHNIQARSIKEDIGTAACSIENAMQKSMKKMYHKVKNKLKTDLNEEIKEAKSTIKKKTNKAVNKITQSMKTTKAISHNKKSTTSQIAMKNKMSKTTNSLKKTVKNISNFAEDDSKLIENNKIDRNIVTDNIETNLEDEYAMINAFEQMLNKDRSDSMINLYTTRNIGKERHYNIMKHFKRRQGRDTHNNFEDLSSLHETVSADNPYDYQQNPNEYTEPAAETQIPTADIKDISDKISYKEYVNGFKHYLNFLQDQNNQNFSNLVKFQAHLHHNVNDIGKYILEKLPPVPETDRNRRSIAEVTPTAKDDKWFKKHFYFFIETETPKKFHSTQTVSLKLPLKTSDSKNTEKEVRFKESTPGEEVTGEIEKLNAKDSDNTASKDNNEELDKLLGDQGSSVEPDMDLG